MANAAPSFSGAIRPRSAISSGDNAVQRTRTLESTLPSGAETASPIAVQTVSNAGFVTYGTNSEMDKPSTIQGTTDRYQRTSTLDSAVTVQEAVADFVDLYNATGDAISEDSQVTSFVDGVWAVIGGIPGLAEAFGAFAEHAPLVGVAFSVLKAVGKTVADTSATKAAYCKMAEAAETLLTLLRAWYRHRGAMNLLSTPPPPAVVAAEGSLVGKCRVMLMLSFRISHKGYFSRVWDQKTDHAALDEITADISSAFTNLHFALSAAGLNITEHSLAVTKQIFTSVNMTNAQLEALHKKLDTLLKPIRCFPEREYVKGTVSTFQGLRGVTEVMEGGIGPAFQELHLNDVYVEQSARDCDNLTAEDLELNDEHFRELQQLGQVDLFTQTPEALEERRKRVGNAPLHLVKGFLLDPSKRFLVILGQAGFGKTSLLRESALQWALSPELVRQDQEIPIVIEFRKFAELKKYHGSATLFDHIAEGGRIGVPIDPSALLTLLTEKPTLVMLDGLDEVVDPHLRELVVDAVRAFVNTYVTPATQTRVVITSRIIGYRMTTLKECIPTVEHCVLHHLNDDQVSELLEKWHAATYAPHERDVALHKKDRIHHALRTTPSIATLAKNPLLLTMICIVNRSPELPTKRLQLYEKCIALLLERWQVNVAIDAVVVAAGLKAKAFDSYAKAALLQDLASEMRKRPTTLGNVVPTAVITDVCARHVTALFGGPRPVVVAAVIEQLRERHGIICFLGGQSYAFMHKTFFEYFVAKALHSEYDEKTLNLAGLLDLYCTHSRTGEHDAGWREVLILLTGMLPAVASGPCLAKLLESGNTYLAGLCAEQLKLPRFVPQSQQVRDALFADIRAGEGLWTANDAEFEARLDLVARLWPDDARTLLTGLSKSGFPASSTVEQHVSRLWPDHVTLQLPANLQATSAGAGAQPATQMNVIGPVED